MNLFNANGLECKNNQCSDKTLTTNDGQTISLDQFEKIDIKDDARCVQVKNDEIKSKPCEDELKVICEKNCQVTENASRNPTSNSGPCNNQGLAELADNQKYYKAVESSGGFHTAHDDCANLGMELADMTTVEGFNAIKSTLGKNCIPGIVL